jgi:DNA-binding winged helix-turn-helix (wHTH) protein
LSEAPVQTDVLEIDLRRYELRRGSSVLKLEKILMELLILLVERRDQLVGREEIIARLYILRKSRARKSRSSLKANWSRCFDD